MSTGEINTTENSTVTRHQHPEVNPSRSTNLANIGYSFLRGGFSGFIGRVFTNNLTQMTASYQVGRFQPDFSLKTMQGMVLGANLQVAITYGLKAFFECQDKEQSSTEEILKCFTAGALGRLGIHPSAVAFFRNEKASKQRLFLPEIQEIKDICNKNPKVFRRGLLPGMVFSGVDWSVYFYACRFMSEPEAAAISVSFSTPIYQIYIARIKNKPVQEMRIPSLKNICTLPQTFKLSSSGKRLLISNFLYNLIAILERTIVVNTESFLNTGKS